jgi:hypothetical protein
MGGCAAGMVCDTLAHDAWLQHFDVFAEAEQGGAGPVFAFERDGDVDLACAGQGDAALPVDGKELAQAGKCAGLDPDGHFDCRALVFQLTASLCPRLGEVEGGWPGCGLVEQLN